MTTFKLFKTVHVVMFGGEYVTPHYEEKVPQVTVPFQDLVAKYNRYNPHRSPESVIQVTGTLQEKAEVISPEASTNLG